MLLMQCCKSIIDFLMLKYIQEEEKRKEKEEKAKQEEEEKAKLKETKGSAEDLALKEMIEATAREEELRKAKQHDREKLCNIGRALAVLASASVCSYTISIFLLVTIHADSNNTMKH
jgi:LETM1 and EF-hand domain-containing protein 1, mitochondrial